jgi:hypothetical protein
VCAASVERTVRDADWLEKLTYVDAWLVRTKEGRKAGNEPCDFCCLPAFLITDLRFSVFPLQLFAKSWPKLIYQSSAFCNVHFFNAFF